MKQVARQAGIKPRRIGDDALAVLQAHNWPGNVRQLRNNIERLMILRARRRCRRADHRRSAAGRDRRRDAEARRASPTSTSWRCRCAKRAEMFEKEYLIAQINRFGGNISRTAEFIGMERSALHRKLKSLGV